MRRMLSVCVCRHRDRRRIKRVKGNRRLRNRLRSRYRGKNQLKLNKNRNKEISKQICTLRIIGGQGECFRLAIIDKFKIA